MYSIKASSAEKVKNIAMPNSIMVSDLTPFKRVANRIKPHVTRAKTKAFSVTIRLPTFGMTLNPSTMASAAPKLAAAEMPYVNGSASGLFRMVCICPPASESIAPTITAVTATGKR